MSKLFILFLVFTVEFAMLAGCLPTSEPDVSGVHDGVEYVTLKYGVPPERVLELASLLGVAPDEIPSPHDFDPALPFPIPYFKQQFEAFEAEHGRKLTRPEVDEIVKGYELRCQVISAYTDYLFYTTNVERVKRLKMYEAAVIMRVKYDENPTMRYNPELAVYEDITIINIPFKPFDLLGNWSYSSCIHRATHPDPYTN